MKKGETLTEYSKRIVRLMIMLWFIGAAFGALIIVVELVGVLFGTDGYSLGLTVHLPELLNYIGMPVGGGIVGYLLKSAFENKEKIKQSARQDNSDIP